MTKRSVLSKVNSLFDSLGFVVPVTMGGSYIMRALSMEQYDWDAPLPTAKQAICSCFTSYADHKPRPLNAVAPQHTNWFSGPSLLSKPQQENADPTDGCELVDADPGSRNLSSGTTTRVSKGVLGARRKVLHMEVTGSG